MKTDDLILQLTSQLKPVKPVSRLKTAGFLLLAVAIILGLFLSFIELRSDLSLRMTQTDFWMGLFAWISFFILGLFMSVSLAIPGRKISPWLKSSIFVSAAAIFIWHLSMLVNMDSMSMMMGLNIEGIRCTLVTLMGFIVSGAFIVQRLKKGASQRPLISALLAGLISLSVGGMLIMVNCENDNGIHVFLWHLLMPMVVVVGLAVSVINKLLKW